MAWAHRARPCAGLADLRRHDSYERRLALLAALATRDTAAVLAATYDPEPAIAATALTAAVRAGVTPADLTDRPGTRGGGSAGRCAATRRRQSPTH
ncbi:hypothetical protein V2I01_26825 [Micromonospora sp. BRA006-A]|nr:hypothetical protein [Micromonospora sp. BRA006-A]